MWTDKTVLTNDFASYNFIFIDLKKHNFFAGNADWTLQN